MNMQSRKPHLTILPNDCWPEVALQEANAAGDGDVHVCVECSDCVTEEEGDEETWMVRAWIGGSGLAPCERQKILEGTVRCGEGGADPRAHLVFINPLGLSQEIAHRLLCLLFEETCQANLALLCERPDPMCVILPKIARIAESLGLPRWF